MSSAPIAAAPAHILDLARRVLAIEADAVRALADRLGDDFTAAVGLILASRGRVIVSGVGKSGHIGRKFAATLASTGTPAYFVHAAEAAHGDLGMITADDVLIALSYSGTGEELLKIVPLIKRQGARLIAITGNPASPLALEADVHLDGAVREEACPLNLAPTASTTAALALSDALAVALLDARGFGADDFARSHPGGALGRRLLTHVSDVMRSGPAVPRVPESALLADALMEMTRAGMGMTAIVGDGDGSDRIVGIYTDGDLRRSLASGCDFSTARVADVMSRGPKTIHPEALAVAAAEMMERLRISQLLVADHEGRLVGALNHHDLMLAKVI
ncbi:KpsF/GutQ family sugar-phosphate isomerase [Zoogloea sp.]|uniref:KpsF/GutQ family sugar-phosphate isomerase n=1 Tax=Zoogloea sp. TaxID=49181 RepID=UPI0026151FAD|nr:KpsF/GutQ family sugar-phosphate isomerase [uncultured Zoogloea sp.]MCK6386846.1 KpsF/GutQ family sugar-phosphate isomerase [Zoogloea sp.]